MIRRLIDKALASKDEVLIILALDWAKAFDSISPDALCSALSRFGVNTRMVAIIRQIYNNRVFQVRWDGDTSKYHTQYFGISQGCPLSPFLFSILMTIMIHDCRQHFDSFSDGLQELLDTDDTLLVGQHPGLVQRYMQIISDEGRKYIL